MLEAFAKVRERVPEATLDLVGRHPRVALEGVHGHGILALDDPADRAMLTSLYAQATAFVMPSLHEPAGTVHVEAAAAGIPSIGTRNGGAATCIGEAGYVVDPASRDELFEAMLELCDADTAARLGALGREHARQFTWSKVAERLVRALESPRRRPRRAWPSSSRAPPVRPGSGEHREIQHTRICDNVHSHG